MEDGGGGGENCSKGVVEEEKNLIFMDPHLRLQAVCILNG